MKSINASAATHNTSCLPISLKFTMKAFLSPHLFWLTGLYPDSQFTSFRKRMQPERFIVSWKKSCSFLYCVLINSLNPAWYVLFRMRSWQRKIEHTDELSRRLVKGKRYHFNKMWGSQRFFFFWFYVINGTQTQKEWQWKTLIWQKENPKWSSRNNSGCKRVFHSRTGGAVMKK